MITPTRRTFRPSLFVFLTLGPALVLFQLSQAETAKNACPVKVIANQTVVSSKEWYNVASYVLPSGVVENPTQWPYFAWSDTPMGVVRAQNGTGYLFFGSDGGDHPFDGSLTQRAGSITTSSGTLDAPLGDYTTAPPTEFLLPTSANLPTSDDYVGGGPAYRVPEGEPGAGSLLLVYHVERPANPFWSWLGLAKSTDEGVSWQDLGLIIGSPQPYRAHGAFDIGDGNLVVPGSPSGSPHYFYLFFPQHCWTNSTATCSNFTYLSVARAPYEDLLAAAALGNPATGMFYKYFDQSWTEPGLSGQASELFAAVTGESDGDPQVVWSGYRNRFVAIMTNGQDIAYGESSDGLHWPAMQTLVETATDAPGYAYANAVGMGDDPSVLGQTFYSYYTEFPSGSSWSPAEIRRLTVTTDSCSD
jgi:hypothetical protein